MNPVWDKRRNGDAYVALLDHAAACPSCRAGAVLCPDGRRPAGALRTVRERGARIVICRSREREIQPGEPYGRHVHDRATGAPLVNYSHRDRRL
ncbi:hypothetical protein U9R90_10505 [Streptomyces sp. E11-3]|uniref:hypothetical protein n=1 Tax=Streptomyces sp. E11-3 TaxID=3110112 RepID=UPI003980ABCC